MNIAPSVSPSLARKEHRNRRTLIAVSFVIMVASVSRLPKFEDPTGRYDIANETIASKTLRAEFSFESEDLQATREKQDEAAASVPITYNLDIERVKNQKLTLQQRINSIRDRAPAIHEAIHNALLASRSNIAEDQIVAAALLSLATSWKTDPLFEGFPAPEFLVAWMMPAPGSVPKRVFESAPVSPDPVESLGVSSLEETDPQVFQFAHIDRLATLALEGLEFVLTKGIVQPGALTQGEIGATGKALVMRSAVVSDLKTSEEAEIDELPVPTVARGILGTYIIDQVRQIAANEPSLAPLSKSIEDAAFEMANSGVTDTLFYDQVVTAGNREYARTGVPPVTKSFDPNQIIQQEGYPWTQQSRSDVQAMWDIMRDSAQQARNILSPIAANLFLVGMLLAALLRSMVLMSSRRDNPENWINVVLPVLCATLVLGRVMSIFDPSGFIVPIMAAAILLAILTNARTASMAAIAGSFLLSIQYGHDWQVMLLGSAMSFASVARLYRVRKRGDMANAAVRGAIAGLLVVLALALADDSLASWGTLNRLSLVGLNGLACLFIVPGLLSPLERIFKITTDIQLLEYSDLNNELLSRLAIEVPATYAHSLMLGQLAEAAADAIRANGLKARVCAYYHDIGKMRRPEYFGENQTGQNIHDDLSPRLSSRAIASHVTEGLEMAREFHLPAPIIEGIQEHHGTCLISFFYQQALAQQKHGDVREADYRYPGPKPQSRETAILMICDGVESGVRSIKNLNEDRVREFVGKIIQARSEDRQFDECDLTLRDLDVIEEVIAKRIMTTMHTRIAYPERRPQDPAKNVIPMTGGRE